MSQLKVVLGSGVDISGTVTSAKYSGDMNKVARELELTLASSVKSYITIGEKVAAYLDGTQFFYGIMLNMPSVANAQTMNIKCVDYGIYLSKNKTYKVYSGTAKEIAKEICNEFGIATGSLASRSGQRKITSTGDKSAYDVIREAYEEEDAVDREYVIYIKNRKLYVEKAGSDVVADIYGKYNITAASYSESMENMVNRVIILDEKGEKKKDSVENSENRSRYGTFTETYKRQKDKNDREEAKKKLKGIVKTGSVSALGDIACIAGKAIRLSDTGSKLKDEYTISADSHTFSQGNHQMSLTLYFKQEE